MRPEVWVPILCMFMTAVFGGVGWLTVRSVNRVDKRWERMEAKWDQVNLQQSRLSDMALTIGLRLEVIEDLHPNHSHKSAR